MKLQNRFIEYCNISKFEINPNQIKIIDSLEKFSEENFNISLLKSFFNKHKKLGFYLITLNFDLLLVSLCTLAKLMK